MNASYTLPNSTTKLPKPKDDPSKRKEKHERTQINTKILSTDNEISARALKKWEEAKFSEKNIHQRSYHSAVIYNSSLYIFGGYEINKGIMNDFHSLDLESKECYAWTSLLKKNPNSLYPGYFLYKLFFI